ncbi:MAG: phospho-sugar mutase [Bacilli bacterium]
MQTFAELLRQLKVAKKYINDPEQGIVLTKAQIGESISINFEEACETYTTGALQDAISFDKDIVVFLENHKAETTNEIIFKLQYFLNKTLPFSYKALIFRNLFDLGQAINDKKIDDDDVVEILKYNLISYFIESETIIKIGERKWTLIRIAEILAPTHPGIAVNLLGYAIGDNQTYIYDNEIFNTVDELLIHLLGCQKFEKFSDTFNNDDRFLAWLIFFGHQKALDKWLETVKKDEKAYADLDLLLASIKIQKPKSPKKAIKEEMAKPVETIKEEVKPVVVPVIKVEKKKVVKKEVVKVTDPIELAKQSWLKSKLVSPKDKRIIRAMNEDETKVAFGSSIEFGTAGLRGIMNPGNGNMNIFTIRKAATAYGKYVLKYVKNAKSKGIVIGHDNRHNSEEFTQEAAKTLASLGFKVYLYKHIVSTPEISFSVSHLKCAGGIVITASHNPKIYNGFKVYDQHGCQLVPSLIKKLQPFYDAINNPLELAYKEEGLKSKIIYLKKEIDLAYYNSALNVQIDKSLNPKDLTIVYTSLHGTGYRGVEYVCKKLGYNLVLVTKQCVEDPNFSTTKSPNPEEPVAYEKALETAKTHPCDLIIATDPDADRIGIVIFHNGEPVYLTGNQTGALLIDYNIQARKRTKTFQKGMVLFDTIVTSKFGSDIARYNKCKVVSTLTGFKFVGEQIGQLKDHSKFLFGYEESFGYILSPTTRDKDALQASVGIMEMTNYYKKQGKDLVDALDDLYAKYGCHIEHTDNMYFKGSEAQKDMQDLMTRIRNNPPKSFYKQQVKTLEDYETSIATTNGRKKKLTLPKSNVLRFLLDDGSFIAIRPSGTEPKCKFYYCIVADTKKQADKKLTKIKKAIDKLVG